MRVSSRGRGFESQSQDREGTEEKNRQRVSTGSLLQPSLHGAEKKASRYPAAESSLTTLEKLKVKNQSIINED
ncbi:MAG: hypothetical protein D3922_16325 [Candidatus Electrothrix sp. AR1]|nr:hypothetical protein [Candidatus Electrothrix sp. AR1]